MYKIVQIYEKRIDNALKARDNCYGKWGYDYWSKVAGILLHNLNKLLEKDKKNGSLDYYH
jgi:hypothetical protein